MKKELIEFVSLNFETIKRKFSENEYSILKEMFEDKILNEVNLEELNYFLENQLLNANNTNGLIEVINSRSLDIDLNNDKECNELFEMIKKLR